MQSGFEISCLHYTITRQGKPGWSEIQILSKAGINPEAKPRDYYGTAMFTAVLLLNRLTVSFYKVNPIIIYRKLTIYTGTIFTTH